MRGVCRADARALATSVFPTPASPSRKSGRFSRSARKIETASPRSAMYRCSANASWSSSTEPGVFAGPFTATYHRDTKAPRNSQGIDLATSVRRCSLAVQHVRSHAHARPARAAAASSTRLTYTGAIAVRYSADARSEEHTSELQSPCNLVCRLLLEKTI